MKLFNIHILSQKTLDERLVEARQQARVIPNKMISSFLRKQAGQPMMKQAIENNRKLADICRYLGEKVR